MQHTVSTIPTLEQLGLALRAHMAARNWSLRDAAKEIGIAHATLARATHGKSMTASHYIKLVKKVWQTPIAPIDNPYQL